MRIGVLAWQLDEFESRLLERAARTRGHDVHVFTVEDITCDHDGAAMEVQVRGRNATTLDLVISRVRLRASHWQADVDRLMLLDSVDGLPMVDAPAAFLRARSKLQTMKLLENAGLPVPATRLFDDVQQVERLVSRQGTAVLKASYGFGGHDVILVDSKDWDSERSSVARFMERHGAILVQPFLAHPEGDVRVNVIGGVAAASFRRVPPVGGWKTNISQGGSARRHAASPEVRRLAEEAAAALSLHIAGVDIIEHDGRHVVLEVNSAPGLCSLDPDQQDETAAAMLDCALAAARAGG